jgi:kynurenine formamidase
VGNKDRRARRLPADELLRNPDPRSKIQCVLARVGGDDRAGTDDYSLVVVEHRGLPRSDAVEWLVEDEFEAVAGAFDGGRDRRGTMPELGLHAADIELETAADPDAAA